MEHLPGPYVQTVDACHGIGNAFHLRCSDIKSHVAAIRCCGYDGQCAGSVGHAWGCHQPLTIPKTTKDGMASAAEAVEECHAHGWRLCTIDELETCCNGLNECGYDHHMAWTSTTCGDEVTGYIASEHARPH